MGQFLLAKHGPKLRVVLVYDDNFTTISPTHRRYNVLGVDIEGDADRKVFVHFRRPTKGDIEAIDRDGKGGGRREVINMRPQVLTLDEEFIDGEWVWSWPDDLSSIRIEFRGGG